MFGRRPFISGNHICGCYFNTPNQYGLQRTYLHQAELAAHTTILATTSRTKLTQRFTNPSNQKGIKELRYTFPLYDGVSVVGFTCRIGDRIIVGSVKEKEKAKAVFQEAIDSGETAGLLEQLPDASDVFTTTVGNVPAGAVINVEITYLGELKHDAEVDGIRFTIPTFIAPRYGKYPGEVFKNDALHTQGRGISIIVDAEMPEGSFIQQIRSPSHPIAVSMGTTSTNSDQSMSRASATLSLGSAELDSDFVLQVVAKDTGVPKAVMERHPRFANHRALMATLVPMFSLPAERPEIVFVCDRSGSMGGSSIELARSALKVFLKSLPLGVKFNICSFGSRYSFLWPRSQTYTQSTLDEAMRHAESLQANMGGTEMFSAVQATLKERYNDISLEVILLTDGEIWNQEQLFDYLNKEVVESKAPIRVFTLGIGSGASHSLIEGLARAGNGFAQTVVDGEKMDNRVVRMLKGALSPHVNDYSLEVKYHNGERSTEDEDDFEIVEKVADSLRIHLDFSEPQAKTENKKPISLFDNSTDLDNEEKPTEDVSGEARYSHLPAISVPKLLQAPHRIPPLFPFVRSTVYLLMGPDSVQKTPKSVLLRGTSSHGPLELEIPVQILDTPGETIHQLAAKKAIHELEEGRGWITEAKDQTGELLKTKFESRYQDMVEREAVRLGVQFQVGGKWCSFVAVENKPDGASSSHTATNEHDWLDVQSEVDPNPMPNGKAQRHGAMQPRHNHRMAMAVQTPAAYPGGSSSFGLQGHIPSGQHSHHMPLTLPSEESALMAHQAPMPVQPTGFSASSSNTDSNLGSVFGSFSGDTSGALAGALTQRTTPSSTESALDVLIRTQTFEGSWEWESALFAAIGASEAAAEKLVQEKGADKKVVATALAVAFFEKKLESERDTWELMVDKARAWLAGHVAAVADVVEAAAALLGSRKQDEDNW